MGRRSRCTPLGRRRGRPPPLAAGDLVDLVDEDDPVVLGPVERLARHPLHVDQPGGLLLGEHLQRLRHRQLPLPLPAAAEDRAQDRPAQVARTCPAAPEPSPPCPGRPSSAASASAPLGHLDLDRLARRASRRAAGRARAALCSAAPPAALTRRARRARRLLGRASPRPRRPAASAISSSLTSLTAASTRSRIMRVDVAADVADLGELGGLDLDEGAPASRASRRAISVFPTPVGPIMMMFLGSDLVAQRRRRPAGGASGCAARWPRRAWRSPWPTM